MLLWYLRRAVPWAALLGCLLAAGVLVALAHRWESFTGLGLPLVALLAAAAAALVLDEPAVAVTALTPRGRRWAVTGRLGAALLPLGSGLLLVLAHPGDVDESGWAVLLAGLGGVVLLAALTGHRRQLPRPGAAIASAVVLLGLVPLVLGLFFDLRSPYPPLTDGLITFWSTAAAVTLLACVMLLSRPLGAPRTVRRTGRGAPSDVPGVPMNVTTPGASR